PHTRISLTAPVEVGALSTVATISPSFMCSDFGANTNLSVDVSPTIAPIAGQVLTSMVFAFMSRLRSEEPVTPITQKHLSHVSDYLRIFRLKGLEHKLCRVLRADTPLQPARDLC